MTITPTQAKQLSTDFALALSRETNDEVIATGQRLVNLFASAAKAEDDKERAQMLGNALKHNLLVFMKTKVAAAAGYSLMEYQRVHSTREDPLKSY